MVGGKRIRTQTAEIKRGTSLVLQWLGLCASIAGGTGSIPGRGTKIPQAVWCGPKQRKEKKREIKG